MSENCLVRIIRRYSFICFSAMVLLWPVNGNMVQKAAAQDAPAVTPAPANTPPGSPRRRPVTGINTNPTPFSVNSRGMTREEREARREEARRRTGSSSRPPAAVNAVQGTPEIQGATKEAPAPSGGDAGVVGGGELPSVKFPPDALKSVLRFSPPDIIISQDKEFEVAVMLHNQKRQPVEAFQFIIEYDPRWLEFRKYDADAIGAYLDDADGGVWVERSPGRLHFTAELNKPIMDDQIGLLYLRFSPRGAVGRTFLRFAGTSQDETAVFSNGANILGNETAGLQGVVQANVFIQSKPVDEDMEAALVEAGLMPPVKEAKLKGWPVAPADAKIDAPVVLSLQAPEKPVVQAGEDFWVDLVLYNDQQAPIDSVGAAIQFDPKVLRVIDEDSGNWITRGINIWDGAFHDAYPFDVFRTNKVDNKNGVIRYETGRYDTPYAFPTGIFARVHFRALAPAETTSIQLIRSTRPGLPLTYVQSYGNDRLARSRNSEASPLVRMRVVAEAATK